MNDVVSTAPVSLPVLGFGRFNFSSPPRFFKTSWRSLRQSHRSPAFQGLTLAHFTAHLEDLRGHIALIRAQLEHLRDTSPGYVGLYRGHSHLKLSGKGQSKLKLSGNGNE